jgi:hypothetical protein
MSKAMQSMMYETLLASISLEHHILAECLAMAKYAFSSGLKVPGWLTERLDNIAVQELGEEVKQSITHDMPSAEDQHAPHESLPQGERSANAKELAAIHGRLSEIIAPATPRTVLLLATETARMGFWSFLGPVRLVRGMAIVAIVCLLAFIALSLSSEVNTESIGKNIFESHGFTLLINLSFLMTAAGLGACFAALFLANRYIAQGTFDPKYESSYWIRFILGLMAGLILSQLIPLSNSHSSTVVVTRPMLAMLGGFSAAVVYRMVNRLIEALESLASGETREINAVQEQAAQARLAAQSAQTRVQLAASLTKLQQQLGAHASPEVLQQELDRVMKNLVPFDEEPGR